MPAEFLQAGIESFGRPDKAAADAEMLALGLDATAHYGIAKPEIRIGDVGLFAALVAALDLAPAWKRRLVKDFNRKTSLAHDLDCSRSAPPASGRNTRACWRRWPAPIRRPRRRWSPICSRSPASPPSAAARSAKSPSAFSNRRRSGPPPSLPRETRALIEQFLAIAGDPDEAAAELRALAADAGLEHGPRARPVRDAHRLPRRARHRSRRASASPPASAAASTTTPASCSSCTIRPRAPNGPLVAGGRYDELLTRLGAKSPIPAVGFSVWIERVAAGGGAA